MLLFKSGTILITLKLVFAASQLSTQHFMSKSKNWLAWISDNVFQSIISTIVTFSEDISILMELGSPNQVEFYGNI